MVWARRYVWAAMYETLRNDIEGVGAAYLYDDDRDECDRRALLKAAEQILKTMRRRAGKR